MKNKKYSFYFIDSSIIARNKTSTNPISLSLSYFLVDFLFPDDRITSASMYRERILWEDICGILEMQCIFDIHRIGHTVHLRRDELWNREICPVSRIRSWECIAEIHIDPISGKGKCSWRCDHGAIEHRYRPVSVRKVCIRVSGLWEDSYQGIVICGSIAESIALHEESVVISW